jgi:hypothetical protein
MLALSFLRLNTASQVDRKHYHAEYVELMVQEQYVGRTDMWRLVEQLESTCVYVGQEVSFLGSSAARITGIHLNGKKVAPTLATKNSS